LTLQFGSSSQCRLLLAGTQQGNCKAISQTNPPCDPNFGEALVAQLAASLAASLNLQKFSLEGDSLVVIAALNNPSITLDWHIESVIANTLSILPPLGS
jgi:hypothetical protein